MRLRRQHASRGGEALVMLRSMCHELRPPMATLSSLMRAIEEQPAGEQRAEMARLAAEHAAHAQRVLSEASALAAGLTGGPGAAGPLHGVLPSVLATAPEGRLTVEADPDARQWPVHQQHTRQILINLVGNAARYSGGRIRVGARLRGRRLRLTVTDEGGLTPDLRRALHRRTPPVNNKGLGLWVVRDLTAAHGGSLRARAARPAGLVIEVRLPRYRV